MRKEILMSASYFFEFDSSFAHLEGLDLVDLKEVHNCRSLPHIILAAGPGASGDGTLVSDSSIISWKLNLLNIF